MNKIFLKTIAIIGVVLSSNFAIGESVKEVLNNPENYKNKVQYNNDLYSSEIPTTVFLMINDEMDKAIELVNDGVLTAGEKVIYKGRPYTDIEWAKLRGYEDFANNITVSKQQSSKAERIKRNRESLFTNMELIQVEKLREQKLLEEVDSKIEEIKSENDDTQEIFRNIAIDLIMQGYNELATHYVDEINNVDKMNNNDINLLMATTFTESLEGGNVEFALKLIYDYNADPKIKNEKNMNVMHFAAYNNGYKVLFAMADLGVSFLNVDEQNMMPIDYAVEAEAVNSVFILSRLIELWNKENL